MLTGFYGTRIRSYAKYFCNLFDPSQGRPQEGEGEWGTAPTPWAWSFVSVAPFCLKVFPLFLSCVPFFLEFCSFFPEFSSLFLEFCSCFLEFCSFFHESSSLFSWVLLPYLLLPETDTRAKKHTDLIPVPERFLEQLSCFYNSLCPSVGPSLSI